MSSVHLAALSAVLKEEFFKDRDSELLAYLESQSDQDDIRRHLSEVSGVRNDKVLDDLIAVGVNAETFTAMMLLPLIRVAWADGTIQENEREAILQAAHQVNIEKGSANYKLLDDWLFDRPKDRLFETWNEYVRALCRELPPTSLEEIKQKTMERVHHIAEVSGGILGLAIGNCITKNEQLAMADIERSFSLR